MSNVIPFPKPDLDNALVEKLMEYLSFETPAEYIEYIRRLQTAQSIISRLSDTTSQDGLLDAIRAILPSDEQDNESFEIFMACLVFFMDCVLENLELQNSELRSIQSGLT